MEPAENLIVDHPRFVQDLNRMPTEILDKIAAEIAAAHQDACGCDDDRPQDCLYSAYANLRAFADKGPRCLAVAAQYLYGTLVLFEGSNGVDRLAQVLEGNQALASHVRRLIVLPAADETPLAPLYDVPPLSDPSLDVVAGPPAPAVTRVVAACGRLEQVRACFPHPWLWSDAVPFQTFRNITELVLWGDADADAGFDPRDVVRMLARMPALRSLELTSLRSEESQPVGFYDSFNRPFALRELTFGHCYAFARDFLAWLVHPVHDCGPLVLTIRAEVSLETIEEPDLPWWGSSSTLHLITSAVEELKLVGMTAASDMQTVLDACWMEDSLAIVDLGPTSEGPAPTKVLVLPESAAVIADADAGFCVHIPGPELCFRAKHGRLRTIVFEETRVWIPDHCPAEHDHPSTGLDHRRRVSRRYSTSLGYDAADQRQLQIHFRLTLVGFPTEACVAAQVPSQLFITEWA